MRITLSPNFTRELLLYNPDFEIERDLRTQSDVQEITKIIPLLPNLIRIPVLSYSVSLKRELIDVVNAHPTLQVMEIEQAVAKSLVKQQVPLERVYVVWYALRQNRPNSIQSRVLEALAVGVNISTLCIHPTSRLLDLPLGFSMPKIIQLSEDNTERWTPHSLLSLLDNLFQLFRGSPQELRLPYTWEVIASALEPHVPLFARLGSVLSLPGISARFKPSKMRAREARLTNEKKEWQAWISEALLTETTVEAQIDASQDNQSRTMGQSCSCGKLLHSRLGLFAIEAKDLDKLTISYTLEAEDRTLDIIDAYVGLTPYTLVSSMHNFALLWSFTHPKLLIQTCLGSHLSSLTRLTHLTIYVQFLPAGSYRTDDGRSSTPEFRENILEGCKALVREVPSLQRVDIQLYSGRKHYTVYTQHRLLMEGGPEARMASSA
jgi:hypothetical protein